MFSSSCAFLLFRLFFIFKGQLRELITGNLIAIHSSHTHGYTHGCFIHFSHLFNLVFPYIQNMNKLKVYTVPVYSGVMLMVMTAMMMALMMTMLARVKTQCYCRKPSLTYFLVLFCQSLFFLTTSLRVPLMRFLILCFSQSTFLL